MIKRVANVLLLVSLLHFGGLLFALHPPPQRISPVAAMKERVLQVAQLKWEPVGWKIIFKLDVLNTPPEKTYLGITYCGEKKIVIFIRPSYTVEDVAATLTHELAHVFACERMTDTTRAEWLQIRKLPANVQWSNTKLENHGYLLGEEDFAECLSWTYQKQRFLSKLGPTPTRAQRIFLRKWMMGMSAKASN